ncbi:MAG: hypothetical protein Q4C10_05505 [Clostridia bacterium]|nr:hypothetical protein [Clostridia bacterium]
MKKLIALLIALMVFALPFASAETLLISDPVLSAAGQTIDLTGLEIAAGVNGNDDFAVVQIDFNGNGQKLYGITLNVTPDGHVLIAPDGISNVYYMDVPMDVGNLQNIELPQLDLDGVIETLSAGIEMDGDTIRIPYNVINEALAQIAPQLEGIEIAGVSGAEIAQALTQLKDGNSGITIEASLGDADGAMTISAKGELVQDGTPTGQNVFNANLTLGENVDFTLDLMGQATVHFATNGDRITIGGSAEGTDFELTFTASTNDATPAMTEIDGTNAIDITALSEEETEALGNEIMTAASGLLMFVVGALGIAA